MNLVHIIEIDYSYPFIPFHSPLTVVRKGFLDPGLADGTVDPTVLSGDICR